jgi:hypothetical protein
MRGPLLRVSLMRLGAEEHVALVMMHHIVSDGWSIGVLVHEVAALYSAYVRGEESPLAELPIQYADFAHWQRGWLQGEVLAAQLDYWRAELADAPTVHPFRPTVGRIIQLSSQQNCRRNCANLAAVMVQRFS